MQTHTKNAKFAKVTSSNKVKIAAIALIAVAVTSVLGVVTLNQVSAQIENGGYPPIIQNLASTFNVSEDEVHDVFEQTREQNRSDRLDKLVEEGVITEDQKNLIITHQEEMHEKIEALRDQDLTDEERQTKMEELREEAKTWAEENNIPEEAMRMGRGRRPGMRQGMRPGMGDGRGDGERNLGGEQVSEE
jgi:hypothetical protein